MKHLQKHFSASLIALAALLSAAPMAMAHQGAQTAPSLGTASAYSVLGTAVTTTSSTIAGNVGSAGAVSLTSSTITGNVDHTGTLTLTPPSKISGTSTLPLNPQVIIDLNSAWTSVQSIPCTDITTLAGATITGPVTLAPGVYCTSTALTGAGVLTLDARGNPNAVWIFRIGGALTGTGFSVVMANGGQQCNVFWVPGADVTMTTSAFSGNILAGANGASYAAGGSITLNYTTLAGRALANTAVTMTGSNVIGCSALPGSSSTCKGNDNGGDNDGHGGDNDGHGGDNDGHDSGYHNNPLGSNDEHGDKGSNKH